MPADLPSSSPALDPQTWVDLLTVHALKRDVFSAKTLMTIHEGVEKLQEIRAGPNTGVVVTHLHTTLFERLLRSFNNPTLLKEVGVIYLKEFRLPGIALKHFDLARQFAPKDHDIEEWQKAAALEMARNVTDQASHSGLGEPVHSKPEVASIFRTTTKLSNVLAARQHLGETAGEMDRKQEILRQTTSLKKKSQRVLADYDKMLKHIRSLISQTDFAGAFSALEDAQKAGAPSDEVAFHYAQLGLTAFDYDRMEEALDAFELMRDLQPEVVEAWFNCALVYQKAGRLNEALVSYREAARLGPDNPKAWCNLGSVCIERGEYAEAERATRRALELKVDYARAWDNLAAALSALNRLPEAAEACKQAIHFQPSLHSAWFKYGVVNFQMDNLIMAAEAFNMTGESPDFFAYVLYYMSMIEARRGELDLALQKLSLARSIDPSNELEISALKEIGTLLTKLGRFSTAADFFSQITPKRPDDFSAWLALGTAYHRAEQRQRAREAYLRATELQPDNPIPWHNLGLLASDQGNHQDARDCFQQETKLAPNDAKAWYDLGLSLQALGEIEESATAFSKAERLVKSLARRSSDLSAALSIVRRLNLGERALKTE